MTASPFLPLPAGLEIEGTGVDETVLTVWVRSTALTASCPLCQHQARRMHSRYRRTASDLPCGGRQVRLVLTAHKFFCDEPACPRKIFTERFPTLVRPWGQMTLRLCAALQAVGLASCGEVGARLGAKLGMPLSSTTILRQVMALPLPPSGQVRILGLDDWAFRRGKRYGTILVNLETHHVVDLLPDRTAATTEAWLRAHPEVLFISRDRASDYATAARLGAPQAWQVADRFHLVKNLGESLEHLLVRQQRSLQQAMRAVASAGAGPVYPATAPQEVPPPTRTERERLARRARRLERYEAVRACAELGMSFREIARTLGVARSTVSRFAPAETFPEQAPRPRPNQITAYEPYLRARWNAGEHNAAALWRELRSQGYTGAQSALRAYLRHWRSWPRTAGRRGGAAPQAKAPLPRHLATPRKTRWLLLQPAEERDANEQAYIEALLSTSPEIAHAHTLALRFLALVRERQGLALAAWVEEAEQSGLVELRAFARGLRRDREAVDTALAVEFSQGQTEGQVNRVKCLKRVMYGRAGFALLRQRVLHPA